MPSFIDLSGKVFGRLTVISRGENNKRRVTWNCACSCGNNTNVDANKLNNGHTQSCGCLQREKARSANIKHGHSAYPNNGRPTKEYNTWALMIRRCSSKSTNKRDGAYVKRGITVCDSWKEDFFNFINDMGFAPSKSHSIDRIDNNLGYSKENCRWATAKEQGRNKSNTSFITANGKTLPVTQWSEETGIPYKRIHARIKRGWSAEKAVNTPV